MANKEGNPSSSTKRWKPKREVPDRRGSAKAAKPFIDEADDFPREGGEEGKKRKRKKKNKNIPPGPPGAPFKPSAYTPDRLFGTVQAEGMKRKKSLARGKDRRAANKATTEMYPTDENLFIIKQRKRKRYH